MVMQRWRRKGPAGVYSGRSQDAVSVRDDS